MRSFEAITGPKVDKWLVKTVGVLVSVIGATLWVGGTRRQIAPELKLLATGSAAGLTGIEIVYVAKRRISPIYLLDAALEAVIVAYWKTASSRQKMPNGGT
jgi:tetrahydromethanopterin S-methyltransferase subunit C